MALPHLPLYLLCPMSKSILGYEQKIAAHLHTLDGSFLWPVPCLLLLHLLSTFQKLDKLS